MAGITEKHIDIISHSLGIDLERAKRSLRKKDKDLPDEFYRNYWCAGSPEGNYNDHEYLLNIKYLDTWVQYGSRYYCVSEIGIKWFRKYFKENITDKYKPLSKSKERYQDYLYSDSGLTYDEWLGIQLPTLEYYKNLSWHEKTHYNNILIPESFVRYNSVKYYGVRGDWSPNLKEAKKTYKKALHEYLRYLKQSKL